MIPRRLPTITKIGPSLAVRLARPRFTLGYTFVDVLQVAARYLVQMGLEDDWAGSGLTVREYLRERFGVVTARADVRQVRRDTRWLRGLLAEAAASGPVSAKGG